MSLNIVIADAFADLSVEKSGLSPLNANVIGADFRTDTSPLFAMNPIAHASETGKPLERLAPVNSAKETRNR